MNDSERGFDSWAIVEVMGFKKLAGHVTEQQVAGASLLRVDVPECVTGQVTVPAYSKLIGVGSIYMITPTDEATARKAANVLAHQNDPLPIYIPPEQKQLPSAAEEGDDWNAADDEFNPNEGLGDDFDPDDPNDLFGETHKSLVESEPSIVETGAKSDA
jgi:hypothetical protein